MDRLLALPRLLIDEEVERRAIDAQRQLARAGHHRLPPADLIIAATADVHGVGVLHYDHDFDILREKTDLRFDSVWLAPARDALTGQASSEPRSLGTSTACSLQRLERDDVQRALVRRGEHDVRGRAVAVRAQPVDRGDAPAVAGDEAGEAVRAASASRGRCRSSAGARGTPR